jgi:hypothetical protein
VFLSDMIAYVFVFVDVSFVVEIVVVVVDV